MIHHGVQLEESKFGKRAIVTSPCSSDVKNFIITYKPNELELNTSKGWQGKDVNFLKEFGWIQSLIIVDMSIENIDSIQMLKNLQNLEISTYCNTPINFSSFPILQSCSLEWRPKSNSLFNCTTLKHLFLNRYNGKNSEPFAKLINLESLGILNSPISELSGLAKLKKLRSLRLGRLRMLQSLEGIEKLTRLESLDINTCAKIVSLAPIAGLSELTELNVNNSGDFDSVRYLCGLKNLRSFVFYESTNITDGDLNPIFSNPSIKNVWFKNRKHYSHRREEFQR